jgi:hypothetical protein
MPQQFDIILIRDIDYLWALLCTCRDNKKNIHNILSFSWWGNTKNQHFYYRILNSIFTLKATYILVFTVFRLLTDFVCLYTYERVMPKDNRCPWLRLYRIAVAYCSWNRIFEFFYTYHIVHFCITKPFQTNIFALTKHVHRLLNQI